MRKFRVIVEYQNEVIEVADDEIADDVIRKSVEITYYLIENDDS